MVVSCSTFDVTSGGQATAAVQPPSVPVDAPPALLIGPRRGHVMPRPVGHAHVGHVILPGHVQDEAVAVGESQFVVSLNRGVRHRSTYSHTYKETLETRLRPLST